MDDDIKAQADSRQSNVSLLLSLCGASLFVRIASKPVSTENIQVGTRRNDSSQSKIQLGALQNGVRQFIQIYKQSVPNHGFLLINNSQYTIRIVATEIWHT